MKDYRYDQIRKDWWNKKVFMGLTRNDISLVLVCIVLAIGYYEMNWDWIFGRR